MASINVTIIRSFELFFFVLFTYLVLVYFGVVLLLPLALTVQLIRLLAFVFGDHGFLYAFIAVTAVTALAYRVFKMPLLWNAIMETGFALTGLGYDQIQRLEALIQSFEDDG